MESQSSAHASKRIKNLLIGALILLFATPVYAESCVSYLNRVIGAPLVDAVFYQTFPRTQMAVGSVALFKYHNGISHVALVEALGANGLTVSECNYVHGVCGLRYVPYGTYSLIGFWKPPTQYRSGLKILITVYEKKPSGKNSNTANACCHLSGAPRIYFCGRQRQPRD